MANRISSEFKLDTRDAARQLAAIEREATDAGEAFDGATTKGQAMARILNASTDRLQAEIADTERMVKALGDALGPEIASRANLDSIVADFRKLGLTADDVEADIDQLADAMRRMDEVGQRLPDVSRNAGGARQGVDDLSDSARGANSALANMIGNTAQDLGQFGGIAGSAGVALGQMAEYASDARLAGEGLGSALGSMIKVAGPIAAIAVGTELLGRFLNKADDEQEALTQSTKEWVTALLQAVDAGKSIAAATDEIAADKIEELLAAADPLKVQSLRNLGVTFDDLVEAVTGGTGPAADLTREYNAMSTALGINRDNMDEAKRKIREHTEATGEDYAAVLQRFTIGGNLVTILGDEASAIDDAIRRTEAITALKQADSKATDQQRMYVEYATAARQALTEAEGDGEDQTEDTIDAARRLTDEYNDQKEAIDDTLDAKRELVGGEIAIREAQRDAASSAAELTEKLKDQDLALGDVAAAIDATAAEQRDAAAAIAEAKAAQLEANGSTVDATTKNYLFRVELEKLAAQADGPLKAALQAMIDQLNAIPANKTVNIAVLANGQRVNVGGGLAIGVGGQATISADGNYNHPAGPGVINDGTGPELVELPGGSKVMTAGNTRNYLRQMGGADVAQPVAVHFHQHNNRIIAVGTPNQVAGALSRRVRGRS